MKMMYKVHQNNTPEDCNVEKGPKLYTVSQNNLKVCSKFFLYLQNLQIRGVPFDGIKFQNPKKLILSNYNS